MPTFSVVIPAYNAADTIVATLRSCLEQTYVPSEVIIVDDCSTDNTVGLVHGYLSQSYSGRIPVMILRSSTNNGPSQARNRGWDSASGDYVAFLDADDFWHVRKLEVVNNILTARSDIDLLGHQCSINELSDNTVFEQPLRLKKISYYHLLVKNFSTTPSVVVRRTVLERFNVGMKYAEDHELWLRIAATHTVYMSSEVLTRLGRVPLTPGGLSANKIKMRLGEAKMYLLAAQKNSAVFFLLPILFLLLFCKHIRRTIFFNMTYASQQKKCLVLAPFFSNEATTNRPFFISEVLAQFGKVDIITTSFDHQTKSVKKLFQFNDGRTIYYLPTIPYKHNVSPIRFLSHFIFSLRACFFYMRRINEYKVIYATLPLNLMALLVFLTGHGKLKIADVVDIWPDVLPFPVFIKKLFRAFFVVWKRSFSLAVRHCDVLLTVTDHFMDESIPFFCREASAAQRFYIGAKRLTRRTKKADSPLTIVYIGNIGHLYDFETLLTSLPSYQTKVQFFIIGDGDRKDWLLSELKRLGISHHYFGVVYDDDRLAEILSNCHLGFNGYRNTSASFSYKANTYFAAGLPILNSMCGDLNQLVAQHKLGFNYKAGRTESLSTCIQNCLSEDLTELSGNVELFFNSELNQEVIKNKISIFIADHLTRGF